MTGIKSELMFIAIFLGLAASYGITTGGDIQTGIQTSARLISAPWPSPPVLNKCNWYDVACNLGNVPAWSAGNIAWLVNSLFSADPNQPGFFTRTLAIGALANTVLFGPFAVASTVPFGPVIVGAILLVIILEFLRIFRGSSSGV